jgi:uncharacterized SAM-binding protein YcdF (DUF218 family)
LRLKILALIIIVLSVGMFAVTAINFAWRMETSVPAGDLPENAVVFTGQFDRIHVGLALLREGRVERLFISGVNPGAGIEIERFSEQFGLDAGLRQTLRSGRLALDPMAQNTSQNAAETASWYLARDLSGSILLITSQLHMPRASLALERALPGSKVLRMSLSGTSAEPPFKTLSTEFFKFAATALIGLPAGAALVNSRPIARGQPPLNH